MRLSRQDARRAVRSFVRYPGFTAVAVLSLALAIALNTTMYSVIDALVYPKLEMRQPDKLYYLTMWGDRRHRIDGRARQSLIASGLRTYDGYATVQYRPYWRTYAVELGAHFREGTEAEVTPNYFALLGVAPVAGRIFSQADLYAPTAEVMISESLAATLSPERPFPIGTRIDIDGTPTAVIGIVPQGAELPDKSADFWRLFPPDSAAALAPNVVRLRDTASIDDASRELKVLADRFAALAGEAPADEWFQLSPISRPQFQFHNFHYALIAAVIAVLLIACANLANLQVARGLARGRELAVRMALGAARRDLIAQLLIESAVLAAVGLATGLLATVWGISIMKSRIPPAVADYITAPQTSWRVFAVATVACAVCVLLVGLVPAIRVSRVDPNELLKAGAGTGSHKHNRRRYGVMVIAEIGLALALLSGTSVLVRSALKYDHLKPNYDLWSLTSAGMEIRFPKGRDATFNYPELANIVDSHVRGLPDVADVAMFTEFGDRIVNDTIVVQGPAETRVVPAPQKHVTIVAPSFLRTLRLPILRGRDFATAGTSDGEVIIDEPTAKYLGRGADLVGAMIKFGSTSSSAPWLRIVGIAAARADELPSRQNPDVIPPDVPHIAGMYYSPGRTPTFTASGKYGATYISFVVRAKTEPQRMPITLRSYRHAGDVTVRTAAEWGASIRPTQQAHDFVASMFIGFAVLAVGLAGLGIYGLVAHSVTERRRELGVRLALGADARHILEVVLREGNILMLGGIAVGLLLTKYTVGLMWDFMFEEDKWNAPLFAEMGLLLMAVAVVAAVIPALRATRIDPVESLRSE